MTVRGIQEAGIRANLSAGLMCRMTDPPRLDASLWDEEVYELLFDPEAAE